MTSSKTGTNSTTRTGSTTVACGPGGAVNGDITVPGDKSLSHRSVMLASLAEGDSEITGFLGGEDSLNTLEAFRSMGVAIERHENTGLLVKGAGLHGLKSPSSDLYMGNAGTGMRLIAGVLAGQPFSSRVSGDESLSRRPMGRIIEPLSQMGARITSAADGCPPLSINAAAGLHGIDYSLPMASAQVKSAVLLAGLYASEQTTVREPAPTRDHTERMLRSFGYTVNSSDGVSSLAGGGTLKGCTLEIPADISSAAFMLVAACIARDSELVLRNIGINPTRTGIIDILKMMGADIQLLNRRHAGEEPVADIQVRSSDLTGIEIPQHLVPLAIDELPVVFVAAACASGTTVVTGAEELRVKESDRIAAMATGLAALNVDAQATPDGMVVRGGEMSGGTVDTFFDHRIAMSFCVAGLRASGPVFVRDTHHVETSFPGFFQLCESLGMSVRSSADGQE